MEDCRPRFRLFLFAVNSFFILLCLLPAMSTDGFTYKSFSQLAIDIYYLLLIICASPFLAAMALGWLGNFSLDKMVDKEHAFWGYCLLVLILTFNSVFIGTLLSHEFVVFGLIIDVRCVHFLFCVGWLLLVYRKAIFNEHLFGCCKLLTQWLAR
jgi:hypothetical protein